VAGLGHQGFRRITCIFGKFCAERLGQPWSGGPQRSWGPPCPPPPPPPPPPPADDGDPIVGPDPFLDPLGLETHGFPCYYCGKRLSTIKSLALHCNKAHKVKSYARSFVASQHCPVCLKDCGRRNIAISHVSASARCTAGLQLLAPLTPEETDRLDGIDRQTLRDLRATGTHYNRRPRVVVPTPTPRAAAKAQPLVQPSPMPKAGAQAQAAAQPIPKPKPKPKGRPRRPSPNDDLTLDDHFDAGPRPRGRPKGVPKPRPKPKPKGRPRRLSVVSGTSTPTAV
jgi:hypothetical protein